MKKTVVTAVFALASTLASASGYVLQIGTFDDHDAAKAWAAKLRKSSIPAYLEEADDGRELLRAGPFDTQAQAKAVLERVRAFGLATKQQPDEDVAPPQSPAKQPAKSRPFAYSEEPGMRILYYAKACDVDGIEKGWHYAVYHRPFGYHSGCWQPMKDHPKLAVVCPTHVSDDGKVGMGNACVVAGSHGVYEGDPESRPF